MISLRIKLSAGVVTRVNGRISDPVILFNCRETAGGKKEVTQRSPLWTSVSPRLFPCG
jgi:hypothetical protein